MTLYWHSLPLNARVRHGCQAFVDDILSVVQIEHYDIDTAHSHAALLLHVYRVVRKISLWLQRYMRDAEKL